MLMDLGRLRVPDLPNIYWSAAGYYVDDTGTYQVGTYQVCGDQYTRLISLVPIWIYALKQDIFTLETKIIVAYKRTDGRIGKVSVAGDTFSTGERVRARLLAPNGIVIENSNMDVFLNYLRTCEAACTVEILVGLEKFVDCGDDPLMAKMADRHKV